MSYLTKTSLIILFLLTVVALPLQAWASDYPSASSTDNSKQTTQTIFDFRHKKWGEAHTFDLNGYWDFAWKELISARDSQQPISWTKMHVPGSWDQRYFKGPDDLPSLPPKGWGSYHTRLLVPKELSEIYIYMPDMASAYELWSNGQKLGGNGLIGKSRSEEQPAYLPHVYTLTPENGIVDLYIQTSNYHYLWGGLWYAPKITDQSGLFKLRNLPHIQAISGATILIMSAIFCFLLYWSRPQDKKILYFALFCSAIGIRRLCIDERIIYLADSLSWPTLQALENISMYLMLPFFASYVRHVFPNTIPKPLPMFAWLVTIPFCLAALFTDVDIYTEFNLPFQMTLAIFFPIIFIAWIRSLIAKHNGARMFGISLLVFLAAIINDILNYNYIIQTTNLTHMGALAFVLFQLASLLQRYLYNFKHIENLSESLAEQNRKLKQLDQFKDDFLATTSHELRTPLQGIAGLARTIAKETPSLSENTRKQIRTIESSAHRLGSLVNDILDIASLKHDKLQILSHSVYLEPLIESTVQSLTPLAKAKSLRLDYQIDSDAKQVVADEQRIHQILFNLIGNAIKFTETGDIHIEARRHNDQVRIRITDTGVGIPNEKIATIFKPFESLATTTHEIRGTGLGLAITKKLVELQQGEINIRSKEGLGTTVEFSLPYSSNLPQQNHETETSPNILSTQDADREAYSPQTHDQNKHRQVSTLTEGALVFFADDEELNRELVHNLLTKAGFKVELFANGASLLERLTQKQPDLLLLDWMMPGQSGLEVCQEVRKEQDVHQLPIIMLTAKHQAQDIVEALNSGANDYVTKPYHHQELIARVNSQLSCKRLSEMSLENERLTNAIKQQQQKRAQLTTALNATDEGILLLSEDLDIDFANNAAAKALSLSIQELTNSALANYIEPNSLQTIKDFQNNSVQQKLAEIKLADDEKPKTVSLEKTSDSEELGLLLIINNNTSEALDTNTLLASLTRELAENKERMGQIENSLRLINTDPVMEDNEPDADEKDVKELVVKTLKAALITWERYTHKNKADLAEQSRCWRVYLDGTTAKTRTLDKYLSVKTLPSKPRWRAVIKTANYVLDNCELNETDQSELNELINELKEAYS